MFTTVYAFSILLQIAAAILAFSYVKKSPQKIPWFFIAFSSVFIAALRTIKLFSTLT